MRVFPSLRRLNGAAMGGMVLLVVGLAWLGVTTLRTVTRSMVDDIAALERGTRLGNSLVSSVLNEIRAATRRCKKHETLLGPSW